MYTLIDNKKIQKDHILMNIWYSCLNLMDISKTKNFKSFERYPINHKKRFGEGGLRLLNFFKENKFNEPLISIITVVKNNEKFLEETIKSVLQQNYQNFEYIIIDGGSNDNTLEIINKYKDKIDYWISEMMKFMMLLIKNAISSRQFIRHGEFR